MIFGKPPDHLIKVATLIKDFWRLWVARRSGCYAVTCSQDARRNHYPSTSSRTCVGLVAWSVEEGGRLLLCQLNHILLQPGSCPATESLRDVRKNGFLRQLKRPGTVYGDGAKRWKSECERHRLCFRDVTHYYKMEFTRKTKVKQKVHISGTQLLDQVWRHLKRFVPFSTLLGP